MKICIYNKLHLNVLHKLNVTIHKTLQHEKERRYNNNRR